MAESANHPRAVDRAASWTLILAVGAGACGWSRRSSVTWYAGRKGQALRLRRHGDLLGAGPDDRRRASPTGSPSGACPHYALRTPGYPLFLAACRASFGASLLAVRLVQAALGVAGRLAGRLRADGLDGPVGQAAGVDRPAGGGGDGGGRSLCGRDVGAGALRGDVPAADAGRALGPGEPLATGDEPGPRRPVLVAIGTGLAMGAAILARPSWALFVPAVLAAWVVGAGRGRRPRRSGGRWSSALATAAILAPWWARNARVFGRFVPTALWVGASLYDGISPQADRRERHGVRRRPRRPGAWARSSRTRSSAPGRSRSPGPIPAGSWSWPGSSSAGSGAPGPTPTRSRAPGVALASALVTLPVFGLIALGAWDRRRDLRALALLAGPLALFLRAAPGLRQLDPLPDSRRGPRDGPGGAGARPGPVGCEPGRSVPTTDLRPEGGIRPMSVPPTAPEG